ncbi:MAG: ATP-binding protein [Clostridiaceae bacterium]
MKKSIALKLFMITTLILVSFLSIIILIQSLTFEDFYTKRKMNSLVNNVDSFKKDYLKNYDTHSDIISSMLDFEDDNNAKIVVIDSFGKYKYLTYNTDKTDTDKVASIFLVINAWKENPEDMLQFEQNGNTIAYIFDNSEYNSKNIVSASPVSIDGEITEFIFAVSSFQPIDEAAATVREFYVYYLIGAFIVILLLSFIYSNMISKPLIEMNKKAKLMAKLDFTSKCDIARDDEIGSLAHTLNFLSETLDKSLSKLKESNKKLKNDIEREKELEKVRKDFISAISHELKTPIALIEGYAEGLKDGIVENEDKDYYLDVILDESQNMTKLINDLIDIAQLESGSYILNKVDFHLDKLVNSIIKKYASIFKEKDIKVESYIKQDILVFGDELRLEQVIKNLLNNGIYHCVNGGTMTVSLFNEGANVIFEVANQGEQIEDNIKDRIWDTFFKKDSSRNRQLGSAGLGLSIVKNIILLHNGNYGFKNTNKGVKFYFTLKIKE